MFETAVALAKRQLPHAFTKAGSLPFNGGLANIRSGGRVERAVGLAEELIPTGRENLLDFDEQHKELGFDAIAFYVSFHRPTLNGEWGIFYWDNRIREFAENLRRHLRIANAKVAAQLGMDVVRNHELFHYRFDVYALYQELTAGRALYNDYSKNVYAKVLCTHDCFEESLANRASVDGDYNEWAKAGVPIAGSCGLKDHLEKLCHLAPPGYSDFDRPKADLQIGLGGQLLHGNNANRLSEPQSQWVGYAGPYARRANCPEWILISRGFPSSDSVQLRIKTGGRIWDFHKYDSDPWPSTPHGHDLETGYKLSLRDGKIYDPRSRISTGQERTEKVIELRQYLRQKWPDIRMDDPDPKLALKSAPTEART